MANVDEIPLGQVSLKVECVDRLHLNGYVPGLSTSGGLVAFMREHLRKPVPSPAVLGQITSRFRERVKTFAAENEIPLVEFRHGERKADRANEMRHNRGIRGGVVLIGVALEKTKSFSSRPVPGRPGMLDFERDKTVYVNHYYFYVDDEEFGPGFVKV